MKEKQQPEKNNKTILIDGEQHESEDQPQTWFLRTLFRLVNGQHSKPTLSSL
jgi:hypothetical protein